MAQGSALFCIERHENEIALNPPFFGLLWQLEILGCCALEHRVSVCGVALQARADRGSRKIRNVRKSTSDHSRVES